MSNLYPISDRAVAGAHSASYDYNLSPESKKAFTLHA
jgi:hypothetical protein